MQQSARREIISFELGRQPYQRVFAAMQNYTEQRTEASDDCLLWVEHERTFTQGQAGKAEHVLAAGDIPVVQADRGGQVTYHGPGQLVGYLLFDLRRLGIGIKALVRGIENAMLSTLESYGVSAETRAGAPGVYVGANKIGALGLRVKRGCSYHGLSLNVAMDLEPYQRINPCGLLDTGAIDLYRLLQLDAVNGGESLGSDQIAPDRLLAQVRERLQDALCQEFALVVSADHPRASFL